jgi:hypothetical protein
VLDSNISQRCMARNQTRYSYLEEPQERCHWPARAQPSDGSVSPGHAGPGPSAGTEGTSLCLRMRQTCSGVLTVIRPSAPP